MNTGIWMTVIFVSQPRTMVVKTELYVEILFLRRHKKKTVYRVICALSPFSSISTT